MVDRQGKAARRILKFLAAGPARQMKAASGNRVLLDAGDRGTISVDTNELEGLASEGLLVRRADDIVALASGQPRREPGRQRDPFQHENRELAVMEFDAGPAAHRAIVNLSESPLGQLVRHKDKYGKPFLAKGEFAAGERLRVDYTRGQLLPRLGANWEASVSSGRRGDGVLELTDAALAARARVEKALTAVGPELSGVLIDVCCFLKGMAQVEAERGWPVRSAKIVLKTALGALARHYDPPAERTHAGPVRPLHWGTPDYRPTMV